MIPSNLKIGDTYTEESVDGKIFTSKVVGFDGQGRYISEFIGMVSAKKEPKAVVVEEPAAEERTPIEEMLAEETPKKAPARKPAARKRSTKRK